MAHAASTSRTTNDYPIPATMKAWVLDGPEELHFTEKPVPLPNRAEVLVRIDAVAICATNLEVIHGGRSAMIEGELPFNKNFTPGHEYMGTVVRLGPTVDEFQVGDRIAVEIHAGCRRCPRCPAGMYTSCTNYGFASKGHRANGFTTDGGFAEYAINNVNTMVRIPDEMPDEEATLIVTAGTAMYGLDVLGGIVAGQGVGPSSALGRSGCWASRSPRRWGRSRSSSPAPATGGWRSASNSAPIMSSTSPKKTPSPR